MATRVLMIKADGSVLVHSDGGSYKPLNWMSPPCTVREGTHRRRPGRVGRSPAKDRRHPADPASRRSSTTPATTSASTPACRRTASRSTSRSCSPSTPRPWPTGLTLVRREYPTAIGPVDLMCRDADGASRRGRDQAPRRDRRRRAADPLPRAAQPRPAARARSAASSPPRRSSRRPACSPPTAASPAPSSTTTRCAASTTRATGSSDADLPPRHRGRLGGRPALRHLHDLHPRPDPRPRRASSTPPEPDQWQASGRRSTRTRASRWCCSTIDTDAARPRPGRRIPSATTRSRTSTARSTPPHGWCSRRALPELTSARIRGHQRRRPRRPSPSSA